MPLKLDSDGVPMEAAARAGFGVPVYSGADLVVVLDGLKVEHPFAFSRPGGWVWRGQTDGRGVLVRNGAGPILERLDGEVTVRRKAPVQ